MMKLITLAAGQGTRLRPLTDHVPKCMVEVNGRPILETQIETAKKAQIDEMHVICGYCSDVIQYDFVTKHLNPEYDTTNMVYSLFCAEEIMDDNVIISYGDIIYQASVLEKLRDSKADISVVVDMEWKRYWEARMDNPLDDAETLKFHQDGTIAELGKKASSLDEIQGQYIGLIKFSKEILPEIRQVYHALDKSKKYEGKSFEQMYMTTFLQLLADEVCPISAVRIENGWIEVDEPGDLDHVSFYESGGAK